MALLTLFSGHKPHERAGMVLMDLSEAAAAMKPKVTAEAVSPEILMQGNTDGVPGSGFRRITSRQSKRDLTPMMQDRMQQVCYYLSVATPWGKRIVEIITGYTVGKGFRVVATDPDVQAVIDRFWDDPVNAMDKRIGEWCDEQTRLGEVCNVASVNPVNGTVRLGYIDPQGIERIQFGVLDTVDGGEAIAIPTGVQLKRLMGEAQPRVLNLVRTDDDPYSETFGHLKGNCFYFPINKASGGSRGISELFSLADWIDVFDQMIFDFADKVRFLNQYIWHYTVEGGTDKQVAALRESVLNNPPRQGEALFTNDRVTVEAKTPDLQGADMADSSEVVKKYGQGGAGLPDWFFGDSGSGNRSTADEMNGPTGKKVGQRQENLVHSLTQVIAFVIDCAVIAGVLGDAVDRSFTIEVPNVAVRDLTNGATTLSSVTTSLTVAEDRGWIRSETAARSFCVVLAEVGVEIDDPLKEYQLAQAELQDKARENQNLILDQGKLQEALTALQKQNALPSQTGVDA
ncbi:hypothetical protein [Terriglobus sp. RCC_193]|uniref:hypothetical protein n=1 Tax=Terriglobus sp. RCC_193 TaxID=3239218 RepID=UPI0035264347